MTDKELEEKKNEFMNEWKWSVYDPEVPKIIWQWIENRIINPKPQTERELFLSWFEETWDGWQLEKTPEEMWDWIETFKR